MIRVLHTLPAIDGGGAEKIVYDYCIRMMDEFHFDFITHTDYIGMLEPELEKRGCKIYHVPPRRKDKNENKKRINEIIKSGNYDIVHVAQGYKGAYFLWVAKKYKVPMRIAHSHIAHIPEALIGWLKRRIATAIAKYCATDLFACGNDAAKWMWGTTHNVFIMVNAIELDKFYFSKEKRQTVRQNLGLSNAFVVGNVARFTYQKNHDFLIDIFEELCKLRDDCVLMLVGGGELEQDIVEKVKMAKLEDRVLFLGVRDDVPELLNAMDVFVLPSRFEGLGIVLIEAQANGLRCFASDERVPREVAINENMEFIPLSAEPEFWASRMENASRKEEDSVFIGKHSYNIDSEAINLKNCYNKLYKSINKG